MKAIIAWSVLVLFGGSMLLFVVCYAWDEWQWRRLERRAQRRLPQ